MALTNFRSAVRARNPAHLAQLEAWLRSYRPENIFDEQDAALAAVALLREHLPLLKVRFVNAVDLMRLQPASEHPHGLSDREFDSIFTSDRPVIFA